MHPSSSSEEEYTLEPTSFPAKTRTSSAFIRGIPTTCTLLSFSDKLLLTISQEGRLAYWLQTPLLPTLLSTLSAPSTAPTPSLESSLLPPTHLTPSPLLGTPPSSLATFTQTLAAKTGGLILEKSAEESRTLVLGVGFAAGVVRAVEGGGGMGDVFGELVGLVMEVL